MAGKPCVLMITIGSRGDLNPFLALGEELAARGYHVRIATHAAFEHVVERYGFEFWRIAGDPKVLMELMSSSVSFSSPNFVYRNYSIFRSIMKAIFDDMYECARHPPADAHYALIVANPVSHCGVHLAEYLRIPVFMLFTMPWTRSRDFPFPLYLSASNDKAAPSIFNPSSYGLFETATWFSIKDHVNHFRTKQLGLPSKSFYESEAASSNINVNGRKVPFLYCWSSLIIPKPRDWGKHIMISGYLMTQSDRRALLRSHGELLPDVPKVQTDTCEPAAATAAGPASAAVDGFTSCSRLGSFLKRSLELDRRGPLYIGFGSINAPPEEFRQIIASIVQALHLLACARQVDGTWGVPGARTVIFQCLHHADIVEQELANTRNMCTNPAHGAALFDARRPLLATVPGPVANLRKTASASPRTSSSSFMQKLAGGFTPRQPREAENEKLSSDEAAENEKLSSDEAAESDSASSDDGAEGEMPLAPPSSPSASSAPGSPEVAETTSSEGESATASKPSAITEKQAAAAWDKLIDNTLIIQEARHSELFPRCSVIVHHGGAGTFMTSAYAGTAQIPVPFFGDQFLWASVVDRLKVGFSVPAGKVKTRALIPALRASLAASTAARAKRLGENLRQELLQAETTGPRRAADAIEAWTKHEHGAFDLDLYQQVAPQASSTKTASLKVRGCAGANFGTAIPGCQTQ